MGAKESSDMTLFVCRTYYGDKHTHIQTHTQTHTNTHTLTHFYTDTLIIPKLQYKHNLIHFDIADIDIGNNKHTRTLSYTHFYT